MHLAMDRFDHDSGLLYGLIEAPDVGWRPFWGRYSEVIYGRIRRFRLSPDDAADILQEISLRLIQDNFRLLRAYDPGRCRLEGYLTVIADSVVMTFLRRDFSRRRRLAPFGQSPHDDWQYFGEDRAAAPGPSPREWTHRREIETKARRCLESWIRRDGLRPADKRLLLMRLSGRSFREIAGALAISEHTATARFNRLKPRLRAALEENRVEWSEAAATFDTAPVR